MKTILIFLACFIPALALAEGNSSVSVEGKCLRQVIPDEGEIILSLEGRSEASIDQSVKSLEALKSTVVKSLGKRKVNTENYLVQEHKEWQKDKMVFLYFKTTVVLKITFDPKEDNAKLLSSLYQIKTEKNQVLETSSWRTFLSQTAQDSLEKSCLTEATKSAMEKAQTVATALGKKLSSKVVVSTTGDNSPPPRPMMMKAMSADSEMSANPVSLQDYRLSITAVFDLE